MGISCVAHPRSPSAHQKTNQRPQNRFIIHQRAIITAPAHTQARQRQTHLTARVSIKHQSSSRTRLHRPAQRTRPPLALHPLPAKRALPRGRPRRRRRHHRRTRNRRRRSSRPRPLPRRTLPRQVHHLPVTTTTTLHTSVSTHTFTQSLYHHGFGV